MKLQCASADFGTVVEIKTLTLQPKVKPGATRDSNSRTTGTSLPSHHHYDEGSFLIERFECDSSVLPSENMGSIEFQNPQRENQGLKDSADSNLNFGISDFGWTRYSSDYPIRRELLEHYYHQRWPK
jgi:hypothetical protein